uniref:Uncharacterized protein n=1 Tax=Panthera leo TaxID=9689 RepID=A0A8C8WUJ1_PANLE
MSRASLTSSSSWYSASCCCITSRISVISCSLASSILRNLSRSPAMVSSSSRIRSSAALAWGGVGAARSGRPLQVTGRSPPGCAPLFPSSRTRGQAPGAGRAQTPSPGSSGQAGRSAACITSARDPPLHLHPKPEARVPAGRRSCSPASGSRKGDSLSSRELPPAQRAVTYHTVPSLVRTIGMFLKEANPVYNEPTNSTPTVTAPLTDACLRTPLQEPFWGALPAPLADPGSFTGAEGPLTSPGSLTDPLEGSSVLADAFRGSLSGCSPSALAALALTGCGWSGKPLLGSMDILPSSSSPRQ